MKRARSVVITGIGIEVPGLAGPADLLSAQEPALEAEFDPKAKLGRKGLLYKDRATRLALCATLEALRSAGIAGDEAELAAMTGLAVSSNLGNLDTICRVMRTLRQESSGGLSPLDAPNASSNVIASTLAIRYGCRAINLMLCSGATSGTDALSIGALAIRAARAQRMLVVGVEPRNQECERLLCESLERRDSGPQQIRLGDGAACVVLEDEQLARSRGAPILARLGSCTVSSADTQALELSTGTAPAGLWLVPATAWPTNQALVERSLEHRGATRPETLDLSRSLGELYGALGVFQCVAACLWLTQRDVQVEAVVATSGGAWGDGYASIVIEGAR